MKRLGLIGDTLVHKFIYPGHINGYDVTLMEQLGGWMADMHRGGSGAPLHAGMRIVAIASPDREAGAIAKVCGIDEIYDSVAGLDPDSVEGVLILEQDGGKHLEMARPFLERGQFVYIDKPIALTMADLSAMETLARAHGATVMMGSALRYSPTLQAAATYVADKRPSALTIVGPGTWYDYACHTVEALVVLRGPALVTQRQLGTAEAGTVLLEWEDGLIATVMFGRHFQPLFRVQALFPDESREWLIDDAVAYYRGLVQAMFARALGGMGGMVDPWVDARAITRILQDVGDAYGG